MAEYSDFILKNYYKIDGYRIFFPRKNPSFNNPDFEKAHLKVLIIRLSPLKNIRESITHHFLFQEIRRALPSAYIDYAFFPEPKNIPLLKNNKIPFFIGIQSLHSINDFDLALVSNSYTLELFNLPYLFENTGISCLKSKRELVLPIVIMGGSNILMAQSVISPHGDSFVDAFFFGEGEDAAGKISIIVNENKDRPKSEILKLLETEVAGIFNIRLPIPESINAARAENSRIIADYPVLNTDVENTVKLQITQGCPCFCTFCFEGYTRKPLRILQLSEIFSEALEVKRKHAPVEFDLLSFNFNLHPDISKIIADLNSIVKFVNFKSQRADIIALRPDLLDIEILSGKRTYTIGVEGISDRMRRFLHKSLSEKELLVSLENIYLKKPRQIKLFFIITGLENENDLREFKDFVKKIKKIRTAKAPGCRTIMSFGLLSNLPFTPLQFFRTIKDPDSIKKIKGDLKRDCETNNFEFRMAQDIDEFLTAQRIVLAGFECFNVISRFALKGGFFDGEHIRGDKKGLISELRSELDDRIYDEKDMKYIFPFENIKGTPSKSFLFRMYNEAKNFIDSGYCLERKGDCIGCGECKEKKPALLPVIKKEEIDRLKIIQEKKKRSQIVQAEVVFKEAGRCLTPEAKCSFTGIAVIEHIPALIGDYLSCRQVQNMNASKGYAFLFGRFLYDFEFIENSNIFLEFIRKKKIESELLEISEKTGIEVGNNFRIMSRWGDPSEYGFQNRVQDYLLSSGLGFDIRKKEQSIYFEIAARDKKKKILNCLVMKKETDKVIIEVNTGSNFLIIDMVKFLFGEDWTEAGVESIVQ